jgi:hypothetical protein
VATPTAVGGNAAHHDPGAPVRNPNRNALFVGNTPFSWMVRSRSVGQAITTAGSDPQQVVHN